MENQFFELLDVDSCKRAIAKCALDEVAILLPHYSINILSRYRDCEDPEQINHDWDDFEEAIGQSMQVSDYDDLVVDVHGVYND